MTICITNNLKNDFITKIFCSYIYFTGLDSMIPQLNQLIEESLSVSGSNKSLTRMDVIKLIIMTPTQSELRFQGVNLAGADLNRLDLRYINFKVKIYFLILYYIIYIYILIICLIFFK